MTETDKPAGELTQLDEGVYEDEQGTIWEQPEPGVFRRVITAEEADARAAALEQAAKSKKERKTQRTLPSEPPLPPPPIATGKPAAARQDAPPAVPPTPAPAPFPARSTAPLAKPAPEVGLPPSSPKALVVKDASERFNVAPGFIVVFESEDGTLRPYVTKAGLLFLLRKYGFRSATTTVDKDAERQDGYVAHAAILPNLTADDHKLLQGILALGNDEETRKLFREVWASLTTPTTAIGTANRDNLKEKQVKWSREMAETRALLRAARAYTGMGLAAPEKGDEEDVGAYGP